jgi:ribonuclease P/MRP protein subunit POP1
VEGHLNEMWAMDHALCQTSNNTLAMQAVPRHMRRRAAAHDIRRLPRRMRPKAEWEVSSFSLLHLDVFIISPD